MEEESDYKYDPGSNTFSLVVGPYLVKEQDDGKGVYIFSVLCSNLHPRSYTPTPAFLSTILLPSKKLIFSCVF